MTEILRKKIILDTDIGPDCDDTGALGMLHVLAKHNKADILAVTHCTSSPYGAGCIDAINRWYGRGDIPVGTLVEKGFLDQEEYRKYNKYIIENYPNRYPDGKNVPSALKILRKTLSKQEDGSVTIVAIGPLPNIVDLLESKPDEYCTLNGYEMIKAKVKRLVVMGGGIKKAEWNFLMHPKSAINVTKKWPGEIWFSTFEVGKDIIMGTDWRNMPSEHPVRKSYELHSPKGRMSWDLTAVWAAVMEETPYFKLSEYGMLKTHEDGSTSWKLNESGYHRCIILDKDPKEIANDFDDLLINESLPKVEI